MTYIVQADLEARITARVVREILDDDASGAPDAVPLAQVLADAESYVEGFLRGIYDLTALRAMGVSCPNEVKRLCLDVAVSYMVDRHPEYVRADGRKLFERARQDLMDLRKGITRLDVVGAPEPAANQGGVARTGDPDNQDLPNPVFNFPKAFGVF